jgi:hypothetical protein
MTAQTDRVDGFSSSVAVKYPVRVATTANITLSGLQSIDGVTVVDGDRVLVKDQTTGADNGIYVARATAWERAKDLDGNRDAVKGTSVRVTDGAINGGYSFRVSASNPITIGTTSMTWVQDLASAATDVSFTQSGTGAVADSVQGAMRQRPPVNLLDFCSAAKRTAILAGTQTVVDAELDLAIATRRPIELPDGGPIELALPHTGALGNSPEQDVYGAGCESDRGTRIVLTGTGRLEFTKAFMSVDGVYISSAVNNRTFVTISAQGVRFHNFQLVGTGTGQVGIEYDTTDGASVGAVSFLDIDHYKITGIATPHKTSGVVSGAGTAYFNGNKIGSASCNIAGFTTAFLIGNEGGCGANWFGGYCESSVNPCVLFKTASAAVEFQNNNVIDVWKDAGGGASMDTINNAAGGTVGRNVWLRIPPSEWQESGTVGHQTFVDKAYARAFLSGNQTIDDETATKIAFDMETVDYGGNFDAGTYTADRTATLVVSAKCEIVDNLAPNDTAFISIYKNGGEFSRQTVTISNTAADLLIEDMIDVVSGDDIEIWVRANQAGGAATHTVAGGGAITSVAIREL